MTLPVFRCVVCKHRCKVLKMQLRKEGTPEHCGTAMVRV